MTDNDVVSADSATGVSRRTVVAGAAWTVPVVVGLAALPAAAASPSATLALNYIEVSKVYGPYSNEHGDSYFGGVTGSLDLYTLASTIPITVNSITVKFNVLASAFGSSVPKVVSSTNGVWTAGEPTVTGDSVTYIFTWTGVIVTDNYLHYTKFFFEWPPSTNPPLLGQMTVAQKTIGWSATSPTTTALVDQQKTFS